MITSTCPHGFGESDLPRCLEGAVTRLACLRCPLPVVLMLYVSFSSGGNPVGYQYCPALGRGWLSRSSWLDDVWQPLMLTPQLVEIVRGDPSRIEEAIHFELEKSNEFWNGFAKARNFDVVDEDEDEDADAEPVPQPDNEDVA